MKDNKKGFTLVELLAVIVILAIIALIATPIILNVIDDAKEGAAKSSALGFIDAAEKNIATKMVKDSTYTVPTAISTEDIASYDMKGTKPTAVALSLSKGVITNGTIAVDGYTITIVNGAASSVSKGVAS